MTAPDHRHHAPSTDASNSRLLRTAIWVAIGALIAAAVVCVVWVLVGTANDIIGRAFLTILLLAGFAGVAILDARLAPRRPAWFALTSMIVWVVTLLAGAFLIWMPYARGTAFDYGLRGPGRFMSFLLIVLVLQLALLHVRLYSKAFLRRVTGFTTAVGYITVALVTVLALMLVVPLIIGEFVDFRDWYWRLVVAITILAAVGTALIPLVNVLFAPKRPLAAAGHPAPLPWPTYADGFTPLPMLPDGNPDWNAYYTGYPTPGAHVFAAAPAPLAHQTAPQQLPEHSPVPHQEYPPTPQAPQTPQEWFAAPPTPQPAPQRPGTQWPPFQAPAPDQSWPPPSGQQPASQQPPAPHYPPAPPLPPQQ